LPQVCCWINHHRNAIKHTILIGFMCSGKSTVGRALAPLLGMPFVDLDRLIEARVGPLLPFVQREGEEAFRDVEALVLREVLAGPVSLIASGGGTPTVAGTMALMRAAGTVVWLDVPMHALMPRIERAGGDRPLLFGLKNEALRERVGSLLAARVRIYQQAHVHVSAEGAPQEVAKSIAALLSDQLR
jgi:shikimate kinase